MRLRRRRLRVPAAIAAAYFCWRLLSRAPTLRPDVPALTVSSSTDNAESIWTIKPSGRIGNQLGQYATLYALAKLNGRRAYIWPVMSRTLSRYFRITLPVLTRQKTRFTKYRLHDWMSEDYARIRERHVVFLGFPCSWTFYHHVRDEIKREFTMHKRWEDRAVRSLARIRAGRRNPTFVGVHVRRGDYVAVMWRAFKGVLADRVYLQKAMEYFRLRYNETVFVVTSDDMRWCVQNIDASRGDVYFEGDIAYRDRGTDFAVLAHCNHTIITVGTFGYWAAYLAGGQVVYLANFTRTDSKWKVISKPSAAYLPHWVGIQADVSSLYHTERSAVNYSNRP